MSSQQQTLLDIVSIVPDFFLDVVKILDAASLKNMRCLSHDWNCFIVERVWNTRRGKKILLRLMNLAWREGDASKHEIRNKKRDAYFYEIGCDKESVWCGSEGFLDVFDIASDRKRLELDCLPHSVRADYPKEKRVDVWMIIDVGEEDLVVCASGISSGVGKIISIFNKKTGDLAYQAQPHCDLHTQIITIKIFGNIVVTGDGKGTIVLLEKVITGGWEFKWKKLTNENGKWVRHLDIDGDWLVVADKLCIKIWSLSQLLKSPTSEPVTALHEGVNAIFHAGCMAIHVHFPSIFLIGGVGWDGVHSLQVWNGISGEQVRSVEMQSPYLFIKANSDFLFVCDAGAGASEESIFILNKEELCDGSIPDDKLWRRGLCVGDWQLVEVNQTCLITSGALEPENAADVVIHRFWNS